MDTTRRTFLAQAAASLGVMYVAGLTPELVAQAQQHAQSAPVHLDGAPLKFFTAQQAADYEAFASQIFPTDDTPGAKEANVVHFVDYALSEIEPHNQADFTAALGALNAQAKKVDPQEGSFATLSSAQQVETIKAIEQSAHFGVLKFYTVVGFLGDPADGGNKDKVGWKLINFPDDFYYAPPFGWYDAQLLKEQKEKA